MKPEKKQNESIKKGEPITISKHDRKVLIPVNQYPVIVKKKK